MVQAITVSLQFAGLTDGNLIRFSGGVIVGVTEKAAQLPDIPFDGAALLALQEAFDQARGATVDAGSSATAAKNAARHGLVGALRKDALYVEIVANNDLAFLLSTGYQATSKNRAQSPLAQVEVKSVNNAQSGALKVRVKSQPNVRSFMGRVKAAGSEYGPSISFASSRDILFQGLTAGLKYTLQLCAVGGSTGQSDWSDPVEKMVI
jgi:hypothetical protein